MEQEIFKQMLYKMPSYVKGREALKGDQGPILYHEMGEASKSHLIYGMVEDITPTALVITYNDVQASKLYEDLSFFLGPRVLNFQAEPTLYYFVEAYSPEISIERLKVLRALKNGEHKIIVASIEAIMKKMIPLEILKDYWKSFKVGQIIEIQELQKILIEGGYERVDEVESPGQYNIRGGIVDIYPMIEEYPFRIEFFDDEIDSIRSFDVITQRSIDKYEEIEISPIKELLFSENIKDIALENFKMESIKYIKKLKHKGKKDSANQVQDNIVRKIEEMKQGQKNNWEFFLSYMENSFVRLIDYFSKDSII